MVFLANQYVSGHAERVKSKNHKENLQCLGLFGALHVWWFFLLCPGHLGYFHSPAAHRASDKECFFKGLGIRSPALKCYRMWKESETCGLNFSGQFLWFQKIKGKVLGQKCFGWWQSQHGLKYLFFWLDNQTNKNTNKFHLPLVKPQTLY